MTRRALDAYYTPDAVARACVGTLPDLAGRLCWEPHVGGGAFARALMARGARVVASDVDLEAPGLMLPGLEAVEVSDLLGDPLAAGPPAWQQAGVDWIIGNPPYGEAELHVRRALDLAPRVAFLLRLAMLESAQRRPLWREHPPAVVRVLSERPSFTGGGTDSCAYAWMTWVPRSEWPAAETALRWLSWRNP